VVVGRSVESVLQYHLVEDILIWEHAVTPKAELGVRNACVGFMGLPDPLVANP